MGSRSCYRPALARHRDGTPRLYRVDGAGTPRALPALERFPPSPVAPRFEGELFVLEDHLGTAWVDLEQGRIVRTAGVQ